MQQGAVDSGPHFISDGSIFSKQILYELWILNGRFIVSFSCDIEDDAVQIILLISLDKAGNAINRRRKTEHHDELPAEEHHRIIRQ